MGELRQVLANAPLHRPSYFLMAKLYGMVGNLEL